MIKMTTFSTVQSAIMKLPVCLLLLVTTTAASAESCDIYGTLLYEDLGCTPDDSKPCPKKFICQGLEPSPDKCFFRGRSYSQGERVEDDLSTKSCDKACSCSGWSSFTCAILDCPEWLGSPLKEGCYRKHSLDSCCSTGQVCPPFDNTEKCLVDGKEYREGEKFYPRSTCLVCVCQKGFQGKLVEPFCRRRSCGVQLKRSGSGVHQKCGAFYSERSGETLCCPDGWVCPDGSEEIKGDGRSEEACKYGGKVLKVGQKFERSNFRTSYGQKFDKVVCECKIPPLLTCNAL